MNISYINFGDELAFCLEVILLYSCFLRYRKPFTFIRCILAGLIITAVSYPLHLVLTNPGILTILQMACILLILFEGKLSKKTAVGILTFLIFILIEALTLTLLSFQYDPSEATRLGSEIYAYIFTPAQHLYNAVVIIIMKKISGTRKYQANLFHYLVQMFIPLLSIASITYLFWTDIEITTMRLLTYMFILMNIAAYMMAHLNERLYHENAARIMEQKIFEQREIYYKELDESQKEMRMIRHDFKNTLLMILPHIKETSVVNEIHSMLDYTLAITKDIVFCSHKGLNIMLNEKVRLARHKGITCRFDILVPENLNMQSHDLGIIIGNLIDNAIEALAGKNIEKYINLSMIYYNSSLSILIENPSPKEVTTLETSKVDNKNHGFGTKSIMKIVEKYHGTYEWNGNGKTFSTTVFLWDN